MNAPGTLFDELLDASMLPEQEVVIVLRAFWDASEQDGVFCVAGAAFGIEAARRANTAWIELFGQRHCHMTDLHNRKGEFVGISDGEADAFCRGGIEIINQHASFVVAISCDVAQVASQLPAGSVNRGTWLFDSLKGIYPCCLHWALGEFGQLVRPQRHGVAYWFEAGDRFSGTAAQYLARVDSLEGAPLRDAYCMGSSTFAPKAKARLFETADMIGWEWARHVHRVRASKPPRRSLVALMDSASCAVDGRPYVRSKSRSANHYSGIPVDTYLRKANNIMVASSVQELVAAIADVDSEAQASRGRA